MTVIIIYSKTYNNINNLNQHQFVRGLKPKVRIIAQKKIRGT
jgi:hypothetical protein